MCASDMGQKAKTELIVHSMNHVFHLKSFFQCTYCGYCKNYIWGFRKQGYQCELCKLTTHKSCSKQVSIPCTELKNDETSHSKDAHHFKVHNYMKPTFCDHCGSMLLGLMKQGVTCEDCCITVHKECKAKVSDCCYVDAAERFGRLHVKSSVEDGQLKLTVVEAKNLCSMNWNGWANAYCKITLIPGKHQTFTTKTVKNTLDPCWNQTFTFDYNKTNCEKRLSIQVWNSGCLGCKHLIGACSMEMKELAYSDSWFQLFDKVKAPFYTNCVAVSEQPIKIEEQSST